MKAAIINSLTQVYFHLCSTFTTTTTILQPFYDPGTLSGTTRVSHYQKSKTGR